MKNRTFALLTALVLLLQLALAGWLWARWELVVRHGTELRVPCRGYDPSDPVRGRYIRVTAELDVPEGAGDDAFNAAVRTDTFPAVKDVYVQVNPKDPESGLTTVTALAMAPGSDGVWIGPLDVFFRWRIGWNERGKDESHDDFYQRQREGGVVYYVLLPGQYFLDERLADGADALIRNDLPATAANSPLVGIYRARDDKLVLAALEWEGRPLETVLREKREGR